jgi:hypothetical protein
LSGEKFFEDFHLTVPVPSREFFTANTVFSLAAAVLLSMIAG